MTVSVRRIGLVAGREFMAAVANKGFVIGLLLMPAIIALMVAVFPRVIAQGSQAIRGEVAIIDHTGQIAGPLRSALAPDAIMARRLESTKRALDNAPAAIRGAAAPNVVRGDRYAARTDHHRTSCDRRSATGKTVADGASRCRRTSPPGANRGGARLPSSPPLGRPTTAATNCSFPRMSTSASRRSCTTHSGRRWLRRGSVRTTSIAGRWKLSCASAGRPR